MNISIDRAVEQLTMLILHSQEIMAEERRLSVEASA